MNWPGQNAATDVVRRLPAREASASDKTVARETGEQTKPAKDASAPGARARLAKIHKLLPKVGTRFLDFQLIAELGKGATGKVFLAQQGDLAGRYVALKVSAEAFDESQTL